LRSVRECLSYRLSISSRDAGGIAVHISFCAELTPSAMYFMSRYP
jgi:hypothetical protein